MCSRNRVGGFEGRPGDIGLVSPLKDLGFPKDRWRAQGAGCSVEKPHDMN